MSEYHGPMVSYQGNWYAHNGYLNEWFVPRSSKLHSLLENSKNYVFRKYKHNPSRRKPKYGIRNNHKKYSRRSKQIRRKSRRGKR